MPELASTAGPTVSAVVLAYGAEPGLEACLKAVLSSRRVRLSLVVVDNGCTNPALQAFAAEPGVRLVSPGRNLGYAAGCHAGVAEGTSEVLAFVNSDCVVADDTLALLAAEAWSPGVGLATASVRLLENPGTLNSAGNPVHYLGFSWAGRLGEPAGSEPGGDVASVSGACFALRRNLWAELGGFEPAYFAYHEDVDLSLRCWLHGLSVRCVPAAVALHDYEPARHPFKFYLLERNRLVTWLTVLERRTLLLLLPALLAAELATAALAVAQGWLPHKLRGWLWLLTHAGWLRERRRVVRAQRRRSDRVLADVLSPTLTPGQEVAPGGLALTDAPLGAYWKAVRRWL